MTWVTLLAAALLPAVASAGFALLGKRRALGKLGYAPGQALIGAVFGGIAIFSTEFGVDISGAIMNVRDAAPLCAGLIFGAPAGVIAGVIGGAHRWLSVLWGGGEYTRYACSIATVFAGVFGAFMRKHMFEDKRPSWLGGLTVGLTVEVIHMLLVFLTNMSDIRYAFTFVARCAPVMIPLNAASVTLAVCLASALNGESPRLKRRRIAHVFQFWLLVCVALALMLTGYFTYRLQTRITKSSADTLMRQGLASVPRDMDEITNNTLLMYSGWIALEIEARDAPDDEFIGLICEEYEVPEIYIVNDEGVITHTNYAPLSGFDISRDERAGEYMALISEPERVWEFGPAFYDADVLRKFAGARLSTGGFVLIGYDEEFMRDEIAKRIQTAANNRHIGQDGRLIICDGAGVIVSDSRKYTGRPLKDVGLDIQGVRAGDVFRANVYGADCVCMLSNMATLAGDYTVIAVIPVSEAGFYQDLAVYITVFMEVVVFAALFILIYSLIKRLVVDNIGAVNHALSKITGGDLDVSVDVNETEEFSALSGDINATVLTLKRYIAEAAARIDDELEFAREIQTAALPAAFPESDDIELSGCMYPAKEVGGDFYDYYMLGDTLIFLVADVSGKGIPASLFMMKAKTQLKSLAERGLSLDEVFTQANQKLCEGNKMKMFVTAWMGALDISTGALTYVNAGHNPPLIRRMGGEFEYLRGKHDFVLAGLDGMKYKRHELKLCAGDCLFLYTDGVTEATDPDGALMGERALKAALNAATAREPGELCARVKREIDAFARGEAQSDDITMLCVRLKDKAIITERVSV